MGKLVGSPAGCTHPQHGGQAGRTFGNYGKAGRILSRRHTPVLAAEHMYETLAQGEEDTVGVCSACLDVIANLKALKKGIQEVQFMHANITTFRTEVKTWLANQKVHIACLQETHLPEEKLQEVATSLAGMGYQTWCEAADQD